MDCFFISSVYHNISLMYSDYPVGLWIVDTRKDIEGLLRRGASSLNFRESKTGDAKNDYKIVP